MIKFGINLNMDLTKYLKVAINASVEAGESVMEIYESDKFEITKKSDQSPLTKADITANLIINQHLKKTKINILSEENKEIDYQIRKNWKNMWIVDPIDGTKEFINKNGEFTINIALICNGIPKIGVIYAPVKKVIYFGISGLGSFKSSEIFIVDDIQNYIKGSEKLPIDSQKSGYSVVVSKSHLSESTRTYIDNIKLNTDDVNLISVGSSLKICMVAEGLADEYPRFGPTMEWDTAAGQVIAESAGFNFIDLKSKKTMTYNKINLLNNEFIVKK